MWTGRSRCTCSKDGSCNAVKMHGSQQAATAHKPSQCACAERYTADMQPQIPSAQVEAQADMHAYSMPRCSGPP